MPLAFAADDIACAATATSAYPAAEMPEQQVVAVAEPPSAAASKQQQGAAFNMSKMEYGNAVKSFMAMDLDGDGYLSIEEFRSSLGLLGIDAPEQM